MPRMDFNYDFILIFDSDTLLQRITFLLTKDKICFSLPKMPQLYYFSNWYLLISPPTVFIFDVACNN